MENLYIWNIKASSSLLKLPSYLHKIAETEVIHKVHNMHGTPGYTCLPQEFCPVIYLEGWIFIPAWCIFVAIAL